MAALSNPGDSRALLIGVGEYTVLDDLPSVKNNLAALKEALTNSDIWSLPLRIAPFFTSRPAQKLC